MTPHATLIIALLTSVCGAACLSEPNAPNAPNAPQTLSEFEDVAMAHVCGQILKCDHPNSFFLAHAALFSDVDACVRGLGPYFKDVMFSGLRRSVATNRVSFDFANVDTCLSRLTNERVCFANFSPATHCPELFAAQQSMEASCERSAECIDGYCRYGADQCPGVCAPLAELGGACDDSEQCPGRLEGSRCRDGVCELRPYASNPGALDDECGIVGESPDLEYVICGPGLSCVTEDFHKTCRSTVKPGEACDAATPCGDGSFCLSASASPGTDAGSCLLPELIEQAGQSCNGQAGQVCDGYAGLLCGENQTCVATNGDIGDVCLPIDAAFVDFCKPGLYCASDNDGSRRCTRQLSANEPCDHRFACQSGYCDPEARTCAPKPLCGSASAARPIASL